MLESHRRKRNAHPLPLNCNVLFPNESVFFLDFGVNSCRSLFYMRLQWQLNWYCNLTLVISTCDPMCSMFMHSNVENSVKTFPIPFANTIHWFNGNPNFYTYVCNIVVDGCELNRLQCYLSCFQYVTCFLVRKWIQWTGDNPVKAWDATEINYVSVNLCHHRA